MTIEQGYYTSCRTGIDRKHSGFQFYSYSRGMAKLLENPALNIGTLYNYQAPVGDGENLPVFPTEEEIHALYPVKFVYKNINGCSMMALNHAVGADYEEGSRRQGNFFSHVIAMNSENLEIYPCQYYDSPDFLNGLSPDEARRDDAPSYLPFLTKLRNGHEISIQTVMEFLDNEDRMECFKGMLYCIIVHQDAKKKRDLPLFICDEKDNIILWIAALQMVFPLINAMDLSFSTYEYDPMRSDSRICGCYPSGTYYDSNRFRNGMDGYLFDMINDVYPEVDYENDFTDLCEMAFSTSYENLQQFHNFLKNYSYDKVDEDIFDAFHLYGLMSAEIIELDDDPVRLHDMLDFSSRFAEQEERKHLLEVAYNTIPRFYGKENENIQVILEYLKENVVKGEISARELMGKLSGHFLQLLMRSGTDAKEFQSLYNIFSQFFKKMQEHLESFIINSYSQDQLEKVVYGNCTIWENLFMVYLVAQSMKEKKTSSSHLKPTEKEGKLIQTVISNILSTQDKNKSIYLTKVLNNFMFDPEMLCEMACIMSEQLCLENKKTDDKFIWAFFYEEFGNFNQNEKHSIYRYLIVHNMEKKLFRLIKQALNNQNSYDEFFDDIQYILSVSPQIKKDYGNDLMEACRQYLINTRQNNFNKLKQLFLYIAENDITGNVCERIVIDMQNQLPISIDDEDTMNEVIWLKKNIKEQGFSVDTSRLELIYYLIFLKESSKKTIKRQIRRKTLLDVSPLSPQEKKKYLAELGSATGSIIQINEDYDMILKNLNLNNSNIEDLGIIYQNALTKVLISSKRKKKYIVFFKLLTSTFILNENFDRVGIGAQAIIDSDVKFKILDDVFDNDIEELVDYYCIAHGNSPRKAGNKQREKAEEIITDCWIQIQEIVEENKDSGMLDKLMSGFSRFKKH